MKTLLADSTDWNDPVFTPSRPTRSRRLALPLLLLAGVLGVGGLMASRAADGASPPVSVAPVLAQRPPAPRVTQEDLEPLPVVSRPVPVSAQVARAKRRVVDPLEDRR
jgi:hypothetical protein